MRKHVELVAVELYMFRTPCPRPARLGIDLESVRVRPIAHRRVEVVLYHPPAAARLDAALVADGVDVREGLANEIWDALQ